MRLIDADALIEKSLKDANCYMDNNDIKHGYHNVQCLIYDAPTIDAVPVVRCKDCKNWTEWENGTGSCSRFALDWIGTDADDFCSMGERKDNDRTDF